MLRFSFIITLHSCDLHQNSLTDPMHWTRKNVLQWLNWAAQEFEMNRVDPKNFPFSGPQLCSLSKEEFLNRAPPYSGDILYSHLNLLRAKGRKGFPGALFP